ncbi:hypothetical protein BGX29_005346 [Mortierella sp. GBA35]|nr:hypothetical protein BGX23_005722 [Mortierella sp. AD031]KAF9101675.1 hypothetical protein BGX29_005346 [Mortierella sp. GBA35]KAG0209883.1 hypothetical protein BGX33_005262 [Mortierella sp. NVP41]
MSYSLKVHVYKAQGLEDVERFGKNDPYVQVAVDLKKKFKATRAIKNAGKEAAWDEALIIDEYNPEQDENLYLEVLDKETLADEPIAFTTIPLHQVLAAEGRVVRGHFGLHTVKGKSKGEILITIAVVAPGGQANEPTQEVQGISEASIAHQAHIKSLANKESASDAAALAAFGAAVVGAKYAHDQHETAEKAAKLEQEKLNREI